MKRFIPCLWLAVALASACTGDPQTGARSQASTPPAPQAAGAGASDPLPSWNEGPTKKAIVDFVNRVTNQGGPDFVQPAERIATFDNDGTLWSEQPVYVQVAFAFDRVKALAPKHPEWKQKQPFKGILEGDMKAVAGGGREGLTRAHGGRRTPVTPRTSSLRS